MMAKVFFLLLVSSWTLSTGQAGVIPAVPGLDLLDKVNIFGKKSPLIGNN